MAGRIRKIARRTFLVGSVAIAGGVVFGTYMVRRPHDNPLEDSLGPGEATFNPWVRVGPNGIALMTPHVDLGQGAEHMQAMLIAEEMDLEPGQFVTEYPEPDPAYWNTALAVEAGEALAAITPLSAATAERAVGAAMKVLGQQITGGSSSVPDSFDKLRMAGAVARETLKEAMSIETGVPRSELRTEAGQVILPDGTARAYTTLAARAATIEPVTEVTLRAPSEWRFIGQPQERRDIRAKSTGAQDYGIDMRLPGMVHAAVRTNPRRGPLLGYDAGAAFAMRGVERVVEVTNGVAVIADNTWRAFQAVNAIDCEWGPAPYLPEQEEHWAALEAALGNEEFLNSVWRNDGEVETSGGELLEATYRAPYVAHQPLEPLNATALVTDDAVEIWVGTQVGALAIPLIADITGHDTERIRIHNRHAGGSFGHRLEFENIKLAVEIANQMRGTPVKLTYTREEDFAQDFPRHIAVARGRGRVEGGRVVSVDIDVAGAPVTFSQTTRAGIPISGPDSQLSAAIWNAPYDIPGFRNRAYAVPNLAPVSSWRAVGASFGGFFIESLIDELIHAAGADPVEERLRLVNDPVARGVLERAAEMAGWDGPRPAENRGRGIALVTSFGVPVAEVIDVTMTDRGIRIDDVWVVADPGTVVDPVNAENNIQGAVVWGLGHAMNSEITYSDGMAQQANYYDAEGMRMGQAPRIHVDFQQANPRIRGLGEPPVPPAPPALANAIFAATGQRLRAMPFWHEIDFA